MDQRGSTSPLFGWTLLVLAALAPLALVALPTTTESVMPLRLPFDAQVETGFVYFGYPSCGTACPVALGGLAQVSRQLSPNERERFGVAFVNLDGVRQPGAAQVAAAYDPRFRGIDTAEGLDDAILSLGIRRDPQTKLHTDSIYEVRRQGDGWRLVAVHRGTTQASTLLNSTRQALRAPEPSYAARETLPHL